MIITSLIATIQAEKLSSIRYSDSSLNKIISFQKLMEGWKLQGLSHSESGKRSILYTNEKFRNFGSKSKKPAECHFTFYSRSKDSSIYNIVSALKSNRSTRSWTSGSWKCWLLMTGGKHNNFLASSFYAENSKYFCSASFEIQIEGQKGRVYLPALRFYETFSKVSLK